VLVVGGLGGLGGGEGSVHRTDLPVAVGRTSNTAGIGLELADVEPTEGG
jgi:pyruvate/2-oxoglutarate dehydrogenase complex dihydrolipoamide dehydrogenase (E3) component